MELQDLGENLCAFIFNFSFETFHDDLFTDVPLRLTFECKLSCMFGMATTSSLLHVPHANVDREVFCTGF
jgi:hypothetical protein